jgi:hypothetical protein
MLVTSLLLGLPRAPPARDAAITLIATNSANAASPADGVATLNTRRPPSDAPMRTGNLRRARSPRLCEPPAELSRPSTDCIRAYNAEEETALRPVRRAFGGYPAGKYYTLREEEGPSAAYDAVRSDYPVLEGWSDDEIRDTLYDMNSTLAELLLYSPIGPFIVLSAIAIFRDGQPSFGVAPCREYLALCANWSPWLPSPLRFPLPF